MFVSWLLSLNKFYTKSSSLVFTITIKFRSRKENLARALEHEANGNSSAAYECYSKAVDISPSIAHELIQVTVGWIICTFFQIK